MQEGSGITNLQTELNYLNSFKSYCNSSNLAFLGSGGWGRWLGVSGVISYSLYMSSGMFRGKESSNRIELSGLVQDLLNFGVLGSLQLWGWGVDGVGGGWGVPPHTCTCMYMHAHIHVKHDNFNCKWQPPLGIPWEFPMMSYMHVCVCMHVCTCMCMCVGGTPIHPPPRGDPWNQSKFNST